MFHPRYPYFLFFLAIFFLSSCGSVKSRLNKANAYYEKGDYALAGDLYKGVYSRISSKDKSLRAEVAFKQGECYRKINHYRAEQVYQNAVRNKYPDSIAYLRLAQMQQENGKYKDALKNYTIYLQAHPENELAQNGVKSIQLIDSLRNNPTRYIVAKSKEFNVGRSSSFSPVFTSNDADALIFTSNRKIGKKKENKPEKKNAVSGQPNNHLFMVKKNNAGKWEKPEIIEGEVNTKNDEGVASISSDGKTMYFTRSMTEENKGNGTLIVTSSRTGGNWGALQTITLFRDSIVSVAHPAIAANGESMYFVSDSPSGMGGKDIWLAKSHNGKWDYVENLGPEINTSGDEMFPTLKEDGTLYYSSNGKSGLGGLDIFKAVPLKSGGWKVTNMGIPINSSCDDFGMTFEGKSENGFFSSNRTDNRSYDAIWSFVLPALEYILEGKITDKNGVPMPDSKITIVSNEGENAQLFAKSDGNYRFKMKTGVKYVLLASARGFLNLSDSISTMNVNQRESQFFKKDFKLSPLFVPVKIENIYYDFAKWTLRSESKTGLDGLVAMLKDNPNITIEISSHTDYVDDNEFNKNLSFKRAQSVVDYLKKAGINPARLTAVGYGEEVPVTIDANLAKEYNFLPEKSVLSEEFIKTLTPEQQEIANQINRRTEFKVISTTYNLY